MERSLLLSGDMMATESSDALNGAARYISTVRWPTSTLVDVEVVLEPILTRQGGKLGPAARP